VAARLRRTLNVDVDTVHGRYGEYTVLVDGETVIDGGPFVVLGLVPPTRRTIAAVRERLAVPR
jgi:hypothetical protein